MQSYNQIHTSAPEEIAFLATMENTGQDQADDAFYTGIDNTRMTDLRLGKENNEVAHLYATQPIGPGLTVPVYPGDTIEMSVKAFHLGGDFSNTTTATALASALASAFTGISGATTEQGLNTAFNDAYGGTIIGNGTSTRPSAYLNYILFDKNMQAQHFGYVQVSESGAEETLSAAIVSDVEGFVFTYVSNESGQVGAEVYFDDFEVTIKESLVVQSTDYYPFGLQHSTSWTRIFDLKNNFLYNAGSELNEKTKIYEMFYRDYDAALGRMTAIDPMAIKYSSLTPYNYSFNDPIAFNDPLGDDPNTLSDKSRPGDGANSFIWDASEQYGYWRNYGEAISGRDLSRVTGRSNSLVPYSSMMHSNNYYAQRSMVRGGINKMLKTQWGGSVSSSGTSIAYSGRQQMLNAAGAYARNFSSTALFSALGINYHATSTHDGSGGHIPFLAATLSGTWIGNFNINGLQTGSFEAFNSNDYSFGGSEEEQIGGFKNWFKDHFYFEAGYDITVGPQVTLMPIKSPPFVLPLPFVRGGGIGIYANIGSLILDKWKTDLIEGPRTINSMNDRVFTQGLGLSFASASFDYQRIVQPNSSTSVITGAIFGGIIGFQWNSTEKTVLLGMVPSAKWAFGIGIKGELTAGFKFKY